MFKIAVVPGDGIGGEVIAEGLKVLQAFSQIKDFEYETVQMDIGGSRYLDTGELLTESDIDLLREQDAIYFGAIGDPRVKPGVLEKNILLRMRAEFDLFVNHRPAKAWHPFTPLKAETDFEIDFLRENTEDLYIGAGAFLGSGAKKADFQISRALYDLDINLEAAFEGENEFGIELALHSRQGVKRFARYAVDFALSRGEKKITVVDKANVCEHLYGLWREVFREEAKERGIALDFMYVDAMAMALVRSPEDFSVVVTPNMFGDILTDLSSELQGGIGLSASGNINPSGLSMFEPVHGSAPDIAGQDKANPYGAILAAKMMMDHLGGPGYGRSIEESVEKSIEEGVLTPDLGGSATTEEVGSSVVNHILG